MRPIRLSIKGLNSFLEEQVIDFEQLTSRGLFGIFGPTGSGKTSILDGITLSLYGDISRSTKEYINANTDLAVVSFEFEIAGNTRKRYRVERAFKGSKTGGVTTKNARIIEIESGLETIVEDRPTKVNEACEAIIGLTREDFTRTVVLPQGKFSDFLKLKNKDRGEMLERLFNLQAYGDELTAKLQRRAKQVRQKETEMGGELKAYVDVTPEAIEAQTLMLSEQTQALEAAKLVSQSADQAAEKAQGIWQLQLEKSRVEERQQKHLSANEQVREKEAQIGLAETARQLMPQVQEWERLAKSHEALKQQQTALTEKLGQQRTSHETVKQEYEALGLEREQSLPKQQAQLIQLEGALTEKAALMANRSQLTTDETALKELTETLEGLENKAQATADQLKQVTASIHQSETALEPLRQSESYRMALSNLYSLWQQQTTAVAQLKTLQSKVEETHQGVGQSTQQLAEMSQAEQVALKALEGQQTELEVLKKELPSNELLVARAAEIEKLKSCWEQHDRLSEQCQTYKNAYDEVVMKLTPLQAEVLTWEKTLRQLSEQLAQQGIEVQAKQLRNLLVDGKSCPVCGSKAHPLGHQLSLDLEDDSQISEQLKTAEQTLREKEKQVIELDSRQKHLEEQLKQTTEALAALGTAYLSQPLATAIEAYQALTVASETGQRQQDSLQASIQAAQESLNTVQRQMASSEAALKSQTSQLEGLSAEMEQLKGAVEVTANRLEVEQAALKIEAIATAYEEMQTKAEQSENLEENLRKLRGHLSGLQMAEIEERKLLQSTAESHLALKTRCQIAVKQLVEKTAQLEGQFGSLEMLEPQLTALKATIEAFKQRFEAAKQRYEASSEALKGLEASYQGVVQQCQLQGENREQSEQVLRTQLKETVFDTPKAVKASFMELEALEVIKGEVRLYHEESQRLSGALSQLAQQLSGQQITEASYQQALAAKSEAQTTVKGLSDGCIALKTGLESLRQRFEQMRHLIEAKAAVDRELAQIADLEKLFQGKRFVAYMAAHRLKYISGKASEQLFDISLGNYGIETDEDGNFAIRDYKNGGVLRDPSSLSGGETFMVSLALALALSAQIQLKGTAPLEFFFLDEGFGTLDEDTLEVVLSALERLHHERLSIGLISHVESIKNRVPIKLMVTPARSGIGGSRVKIELS